MKEVMNSHFWNQELESTRSLDAIARTLPSEPPPLPTQQVSRISRTQQLLLLQRTCRVPFTPSYSADGDGAHGWVLDRVVASVGQRKWWANVTGRLKVGRLWSSWKKSGKNPASLETDQHKEENVSPESVSSPLDRWACLSSFRDSKNYAISTKGRVTLGPQTSLSAVSELDSLSGLENDQLINTFTRLPWKTKLSLLHKMKNHDVSADAAWNLSCVDRKGEYWNVSRSFSLDLANRKALKGVRYRMGLHSTSRASKASDPSSATEDSLIVPIGALPGSRAQAAISAEKEVALWKGLPQKLRHTHSLLSARPRVTLAGICGGLLSADLSSLTCFLRTDNTDALTDSTSSAQSRGAAFSADLFASAGLTVRLGRFERMALDHTVVTARLDCGAASDFVKSFRVAPVTAGEGEAGRCQGDRIAPTLAFSLQQQVIGPLRARMDSRMELDLRLISSGMRLLETTYGVDFPIGKVGAARLVAWYSPTRREGMAEIRLLEK